MGPPLVEEEDLLLSEFFNSPGPALGGIFGRPRSAPTARVLDALSAAGHDRHASVVFGTGGFGAAEVLRAALADELARLGRTIDSGASWSEIVQATARDRALWLVLADAHKISDADRRFLGELARGWRRSNAQNGVPRIALLSDDWRFLDRLEGNKSPFYDALGALTDRAGTPAHLLAIGGLPYAALSRLCPNWTPQERIEGYAILGGMPDILRALDPDRSLRWNATRLLLDPAGPFFERTGNAIESLFLKPGRYISVLSALAEGAQTWKQIARANPAFGSGSQMGAYLKRLAERGFLEVDTSLDATADSRRKRYRLGDPLESFWLRCIAPWADRIRLGSVTPAQVWDEAVVPTLPHLVAQCLPLIARQYVERHASDRLSSSTRIAGGLWGEDYDFDVAATLMDGSVAYGHCSWVDRPIGEGALTRARREMRETRYGFGRERRSVMLFMKHPPTPELERAALRDPNVHWLDAGRLVADAQGATGG